MAGNCTLITAKDGNMKPLKKHIKDIKKTKKPIKKIANIQQNGLAEENLIPRLITHFDKE